MKKIYDFGASPGTAEYYAKWRAVNRPRINERARRRYAADPNKHRAKATEYRKTETYERLRKRKYAENKASGKAHEWSRAHYLKSKFGISVDEYKSMLESQGGACAICRSTSPKVDKFKYLCIDHCHATKKIRGLLCNSCNTAIGHLSDDPSILSAAIAYLTR